MPRLKSPCGTYAAYQRHLRQGTPVDDACRQAQRDRDTGRAVKGRRDDRESAVISKLALDPLAQREAEIVAAYLRLLVPLGVAVRANNLIRVIDVTQEMEDLLEEWCDVSDALRASEAMNDGQ